MKLTIALTTYDDYHGVWATINPLRLYHARQLRECEVLIVDNRPDSDHGKQTRSFAEEISGCRYVAAPYSQHPGVAPVRNLVFQEARGDYVLCCDSHVMFPPNTIRRLLEYYADNPETQDLLTGPMLRTRTLQPSASHYRLEWRSGTYSGWSLDRRATDCGGEPFEIPATGLGVFSCRRDAWPGYQPHVRGHGGNEALLAMQFQARGDRVLCLPFLRWLHRTGNPDGVKYPMRWEDRFRNYVQGFLELGRMDLVESCIAHYETISPQVVELIRREYGLPDAWETAARKWEESGGDRREMMSREQWKLVRPKLYPGGKTVLVNPPDRWLFEAAGCYVMDWTPLEHFDVRDGVSAESLKPRPKAVPPGYGAGTELKRLLKDLGIVERPHCPCNARALQMDVLGLEWCRDNRNTIVQWLRAGQDAWGWKDRIKAAANAVRTGVAFKLNPMAPIPSLVDEAIRRAESGGN